VPNHLNGQIDG